MPNVEVLHLISQVSPGGASRAALAVAKYSARSGPFTHRVASLLPAGPVGASLAAEAGVALLDALDEPALKAAISAADIVQLHFWNTPELYAALRFDWPPARLVTWLHVGGATAPQVVTGQLAGLGDRVVATSDYGAELPVLREGGAVPTETILAGPDFERLVGLVPQPHPGFNIGYIGTVDFEKMSPDYVALHAGIDIPQARVIVAGAGAAYPTLRRQAAVLGAADGFEFRGYLSDLRPLLAVLDVFGYPLQPDNYSTAELVLQEAMAAGVPAVVFPYGGAARIVTHNVTGLIVEGAAAYRAALEWLYKNPAERLRLGRNARDEAQRRFGAHIAGARFNALYEQMLPAPKRERAWPGRRGSGAENFIESLGGLAADFTASLSAGKDERQLDECLAAEARIAGASPLLASATAGGVLHYRRYYPLDPHLRLWAGLVLNAQGRPALAVAELSQASRLGLAHWRVNWYQAQAARACGAWELAQLCVESVLSAAPGFRPAQTLAGELEAGRTDPT